jgi:hypothetical protein
MINLTAKAYAFWKQRPAQEDVSQGTAQITETLFEYVKGNTWYGSIAALSPSLSKFWIRRDVNKAFSAYKFDLIGTPDQKKHLHLFSNKERWFIDQGLDGMLRNILIKPTAHDKKALNSQLASNGILARKNKRWIEKITKYYNKSHFMIASSLIYLATRQMPQLRGVINKSKTLGQSKIENLATVLYRADPSVIQGLKKFLGDPNLDPANPNFHYLVRQVLQAKTVNAATRVFDQISSAFRTAGRAITSPISWLFS